MKRYGAGGGKQWARRRARREERERQSLARLSDALKAMYPQAAVMSSAWSSAPIFGSGLTHDEEMAIATSPESTPEQMRRLFRGFVSPGRKVMTALEANPAWPLLALEAPDLLERFEKQRRFHEEPFFGVDRSLAKDRSAGASFVIDGDEFGP